MWDKDSPLLQLPHFTKELAARCTAAGTSSVFDVIDLEDAQRRDLLAMSEQQLTDVAAVCNRWESVCLCVSVSMIYC
jgi:pre-mRNA-splicing helicase BRR2